MAIPTATGKRTTLAPDPAPTPPVRPTPYRVQVSHSLADEPVGSADLLVKVGGWFQCPPVSQYRLNGSWQAAIVADDKYQILSRTVNGDGWQLTPGPDQGHGCTGVACAQAPDGSVWTFAGVEDGIAVFKDTGSGPVFKSRIAGDYSGVDVVYTPAVPQRVPIIHMCDQSGNLLLFRWNGTDRWDEGKVHLGSSVTGAGVVALSPVRLGVGLPDLRGLAWRYIGWPSGKKPSADSTQVNHKIPEATVVIGGYQLAWDTACYVYASNDSNSDFVCIENRRGVVKLDGWRQGWLSVDDVGLMHLYLVPADLADVQISVLHQVGWDADGPVWHGVDGKPTPLPLARQVIRALPARYAASTPDLLAVLPPIAGAPEYYYRLGVLTQDAVTGRWTQETVRTEIPTFTSVRRWQIRAVVSDANGVSIPGHTVRLRATSGATVTVGGEVHRLGPWLDQSATAVTNTAGALRISVDAHSLTPPTLLLEIDGLPEQIELRPSRDVQAWVAGSGALAAMPALSGGALAAARIDGRPLVRKRPRGLNLDQVVTMVQETMALGDPSRPRSARAGGYVFQSIDPARPALLAFDSAEDLRAEVDRFHASERFGGWWDDVEEFFGDVVHGIETGAAEVGHFVVDLARNSVQIGLEIADGVVAAVGEFVIRTMNDAAQAVGAVLNQLGILADDLLDWLMSAFNTKDMWDTKTAIERGLLQMPGYLRAMLDEYSRNAEGFFGRQKAAVHQGLRTFADSLTGKSWADLAGVGSAVDVAMGDAASGSVVAKAVDYTFGSEVTWLIDRVMDHFSASGSGSADVGAEAIAPAPTSPAASAASAAWENLVRKLEADSADFQAAMRHAAHVLAPLFTGGESLEDVARLEIAAFTGLAGDMADLTLDLCDTLLDATVAVLDAGLDYAENVLALPIDIPGVQPLLDFLADEAGVPRQPLTVGGLAALIIAIPATFTYKAVYGSDAELCPGGRFPSGAALSDGTVESANTKNTAMTYISMVASLLAATVQFAMDMTTTSKIHGGFKVTAAGVGVAFKLILSMINWPTDSGVPFSSLDTSDRGGRLTVATWALGLGAPLFDFVGSTTTLVKKLPDLDILVTTAMALPALASVGTAGGAFSTGSEPYAWKVADILEPLVDVFAGLRFGYAAKEPIDALAAGARGLITLGCFWTSGIIRVVGLPGPEPSPLALEP